MRTLNTVNIGLISSKRRNLYEILKEMLLIEHHLQEQYRHCDDCFTKHQIVIQALVLEGFSLPGLQEEDKLLKETENLKNLTEAGFRRDLREVRKKIQAYILN